MADTFHYGKFNVHDLMLGEGTAWLTSPPVDDKQSSKALLAKQSTCMMMTDSVT